MNPDKPSKPDRKHPDAARDAMEEINDTSGDRHALHNEMRYVARNRDRAIGNADRTGRHFDEDASAPDEGSEASEKHEAD